MKNYERPQVQTLKRRLTELRRFIQIVARPSTWT